MLRMFTAALLFVLAAVMPTDRAGAHTETDYVAVPAGSEATVSLKPSHGCGDSPTVTVRVRAPVAGAVAGEVEGWSATSTPALQGRTVLEWTGGVLPSDEEGAFPVEFTAPDGPGDLLTFPAVQRCENGEELAWLGGNPKDEYPAPRVLILPPGLEPALTIDDVPPDVPGRDKLVSVVDVDNPNAPPTTAAPTTAVAPTTGAPTSPAAPATAAPTTAAPTTTSEVASTAASTSTAAVTSAPDTSPPTSTIESSVPATITDDDSDDSGGAIIAIVVILALVAAVGATAFVVMRRRTG